MFNSSFSGDDFPFESPFKLLWTRLLSQVTNRQNKCLRWGLSDFECRWKLGGDRWRASMFLWGLTGVTFQLHPVPQPASVRTRKLSSCAQWRHTHTCAHCGTQSPGIWVGEKIPWKIPESWAFKSLDGSLCFKAKGAAFTLLVAPGWMASIPQLVNKGKSLKT